MYTAKIAVLGSLDCRVYGVHEIQGAASATEAYKAAEALSANIEHLYPCYSEHEITVFCDGKIVDEDEYAECWKIEN